MTKELKRIQSWRRKVWRIFIAQGFRPTDVPALMVMAAIANSGTNEAELSRVTGSSPHYVRKVLKRLRQQGIVRGQTMRIRWDEPGAEGTLAVVLDGMAAIGEIVRAPNEKRSTAQKNRDPKTRARGPRGKRTSAPVGVFTPKFIHSDPLYTVADDRRD